MLNNAISESEGLGDSAVLLICGPSSSGKSSIANLICATDASFVKLNTKKMSIITEQMFSNDYFFLELQQASRIAGKKLTIINDIFLEAKKGSNASLVDISKTLANKLSKLNPGIYQDILYRNYVIEVRAILSEGNRCIIDHNIFLDPYPLKKDIFFKHFRCLGETLKIISIYSNFENVILNTLDRNNRFYDFVNKHETTNASKTDLELLDEQMGFSNLVFRQPLRIIENLFSMYRFTDSHSTKTLQIIKEENLQKLLDIAKHEQKKLIGFLIYKNYIFTHISDEELLNFRSDFVIPAITEQNIYVEDERLKYDMQLITDHHLNDSNLLRSIISSKYRIINYRSEIKTQDLLQKINKLHAAVKKVMTLSLQLGARDLFSDLDECPLYVINNFVDDSLLSGLVEDIMSKRGKRSALYPIEEKAYSKVLLNNEELDSIEICVSFSEGVEPKDFQEYDNNLIFLARLYAALKLRGLAHTTKFILNINAD